MKMLCLFLYFFSSLGQETRFEVLLPKSALTILCNYRNANFIQEVLPETGGVKVSVWSRNFTHLALDDRLYTDLQFLETLDPELVSAYQKLIQKGSYLKDFMKNISLFLSSAVTYSLENSPQDPVSVLKRGQGDCIGYANLTQVLLRCAGIQSRPAKGFFLTFSDNRASPASHRWLEITLAGRFVFFYDPQYQNFTGNYILVSDNVAFGQIEKFNGQLVKLSKKINSM